MQENEKAVPAPVHPFVIRLCESPSELFAVKEQLARIDVFGPWRSRESGEGFERPEPGKVDTRITVWICDGESDLQAGWYYRVGLGVVGVAGFSNREPFETSQECRDAVDAILKETDGVFAV